MIIILERKEKGFNPEVYDTLLGLEKGKYLVTIKPIKPKTPREYQEQYFAMIDTVRNHTGNDRYSIHEEFKMNQNVISTKHFTVEDWEKYLENFKWYVFENLDFAI